MRFADKVTFVKESQPVRDENGNYHSIPERTERSAHVSDMATESRHLLYGNIAVDAITIRLKTEYPEDYDYIEYNWKRYDVTMYRSLRVKNTIQARSNG